MRNLVAVAVLVLAGVAFIGCGDDEKDGGATTTPRGTAAAATGAASTETDVTLQEFSVMPDPGSVDAGEVTFNVENIGPDDVHEFVIVKTSLRPSALPTKPDGSMDEEGEGVEVIDEIEDIPVGETQSITVDLEAGNYVLLCNIFDEAEDEAHFEQGMYAGFTVE